VALLMDATLPSTGSGLALWLLESGWELLQAHWALVFTVGVGPFDVGKQRALIAEDLRAVDALQVNAIRQLGVAGHYVLLQVIITICNAKHRQNSNVREDKKKNLNRSYELKTRIPTG
uniref:Uncharacterized protein n=1 Tax=Oncorhynchus kisutch TaxID=8019 RepID=A0A8C7C9X0_ONCKI